jgi:iron-sulfur cluster assembly protein
MSLPYLQGSRIDFISTGLNRTFHFDNPNATEACGCGESFTIS